MTSESPYELAWLVLDFNIGLYGFSRTTELHCFVALLATAIVTFSIKQFSISLGLHKLPSHPGVPID